MPVFDTPEPITVSVTLKAGDLRVVASDRADAMVTVTPADDETVLVELVGGRLTVTDREPKRRAVRNRGRGGCRRDGSNEPPALPAGGPIPHDDCLGRVG